MLNIHKASWASLRLAAAAALAGFTVLSSAQVSVTTHHYDQQRSGANLAESILNPSNVTTGQFGKLFYRSVDAPVVAQPLIAANLTIGGKTRNVLYVWTLNSGLFAFDADDPNAVAPLWKKSFLVKTGIAHSTPLIVPATNTLYLVSAIQDATQHRTFQLHALDLVTGAEKFNGPVLIQATVPGTGLGTDGSGNLPFNPNYHFQRPALSISSGQIYIAFASFNDIGPYHGWVFTYDASTLQQTSVYCTSANQSMTGIWMAGQAPVVDPQGNVYYVTGNASKFAPVSPAGNSVLKFSPGTTQVADSFTAYNTTTLNKYDLDLGCGGIMQMPRTNLVITGSKQGKLYVLKTSNLGGQGSTDDSNGYQVFQATNGHIHCSPVVYDSPVGKLLYVWSENDRLKAFLFRNNYFELSPYAESEFQDPPGMPGGALSISANGSTAGSGLLWALLPYIGDAEKNTVPGALRVFNPVTLHELWNNATPSQSNGLYAKWIPPVVANGKAYVASSDNQIFVYGLTNSLVPGPPQTVFSSPGNGFERLYWAASPNATGYNVMRSLSAAGPFTTVQSTTGTSAIDTGLKAKTHYYYEIVAVNAVGQSNPSPMVNILTTTTTTGSNISYTSFDDSTHLALNGAAKLDESQLVLASDASNKSGSAWYKTQLRGEKFHTSFDFKFTEPGAEGLTFTIHNAGTTFSHGTVALGGSGNALGYGPDTVGGQAVRTSVAVKFALRDPVTDLPASSTGLFVNGWTTGCPTVDLTGSGIDFNSGDTYNASIAYDGVTLTVTITDENTLATAVQTYQVSIPSYLNAMSGYVGFTGSTGSAESSIQIQDWTFGP